jgi:hypothetical protein
MVQSAASSPCIACQPRASRCCAGPNCGGTKPSQADQARGPGARATRHPESLPALVLVAGRPGAPGGPPPGTRPGLQALALAAWRNRIPESVSPPGPGALAQAEGGIVRLNRGRQWAGPGGQDAGCAWQCGKVERWPWCGVAGMQGGRSFCDAAKVGRDAAVQHNLEAGFLRRSGSFLGSPGFRGGRGARHPIA